jgi:hypothetical protein
MKATIKKVLAGILMVPMLALGVSAIAAPTYAVDANITNGINATGQNSNGDTASLGTIFKNVVNILLYVIGALSVIMLIVGGIRYATSAGNSNSVTAAKSTIMYALIGLVIAVLAYAIVNFVLTSISTGSAS